MNANVARQFFEILINDKLTLLYQGAFVDTITEKVVNIGDSFISTSEFSKAKKKVSFLMVECFQNVIRHGDSDMKLKKEKSDFFLVRNQFDYHYIIAANLIKNSNIEALEDKLLNINKLEKDELREHYFNSLENNQMSIKGGAGLGLIEMARKTGEKIDFEFYPFDKSYSIFFQQIKFKKAKSNFNENILPISESYKLAQLMAEKNIFLVYKGDFNSETMSPILNMVEQNLIDKAVDKKRNKALTNILIEILQNLHRHSFAHNGIRDSIVLLGINDDLLTVTTGNYISNTNKDLLDNYLQLLLKSDNTSLKEMSKKILRTGKNDNVLNSGLGLNTIAKACKRNFNYKFFDIDTDKSFFVITVSV